MNSKNPKILIIGGGAAGISAAVHLIKNNIKDVKILESSNRLGGRINSIKFDNTTLDLGAQWCHGEKNNIVYELVKDLNLLGKAKFNYQENDFYQSNGILLNKNITDKLYQLGESIYEANDSDNEFQGTIGEYFIQKFNENVSKLYENNDEVKSIAFNMIDWFHKMYLCLDASENWNKISYKGSQLYEECEGDQILHWKDKGYVTILNILMDQLHDKIKEFPIIYNKKVTQIYWNDQNNDEIIINCDDDSEYVADHVIITVSLGVLKNHYEKLFIPNLPIEKINSIKKLSFGSVHKMFLKFPKIWWPNNFKGINLIWQDNDRLDLQIKFPHGPKKNNKSWLEDVLGFYPTDCHEEMLLVWFVGEMVKEIELTSDQIIIDGCMYLLRKFTGNLFNIPNAEKIFRFNWKTNENFYGTYSYYGIEAEKENILPKDLAKPLVSSKNKINILFAGEATDDNHFSTVHGAIETGYREANRILNIYKIKPKIIHHQIGIIGAGIAGLGAALTLQKFGLNDYIIIEAQNHIGGRIETINWNNHLIDLGAQWIHGNSNPLYKIAKKHHLLSPILSEEGLGLYLRENGEIIDNNLVELINFKIGQFLNECESFHSNNNINTKISYPKSVGEFLKCKFLNYLNESNDSDLIKEIKLNLFDWHNKFQIIDNSCLDLSKLSAKSWGSYVCTDDLAHSNLKNGYQSLIDILLNDLLPNKIILNTPVKKINYNNNIIKIQCENNENRIIYCDYLIVTVSLGVLKDSIIKFQPSLPISHQQCINDLGFYTIGKIILIFNQKWWNVDGFQFIWNKSNNDEQIYDTDDYWTRYITGFETVFDKSNILIGWIGGKGVTIMENLSENIVQLHCMKLLRKFIKNYNIPDPIKVIKTKWSLNPWIRGSYCHITPDCDYSGLGPETLSKPIYQDGKIKILFAGEAVHSTHYSTTHGAYESGRDQANTLAHSLLNKMSKL